MNKIDHIKNIMASFYDKQYAQAKAEIKTAIEAGLDPRGISVATDLNNFIKSTAIDILSDARNRKARLAFIGEI